MTLDAGKLSDDELSELRVLLRHRRDAAPRGEAWPEAERERAEAIVGKSAGEPGLYERRRDELRRADEMRADAAKLARVFLPRRRDPEPGSVELPAFLLDWLTNGEADTFDLTDLGHGGGRGSNPVWAFWGRMARTIWLSYAGQTCKECRE